MREKGRSGETDFQGTCEGSMVKLILFLDFVDTVYV
jgi:hypothetical protein